MWDQLMNPPTLKIMDEKFTVSYSEFTGWYLYHPDPHARTYTHYDTSWGYGQVEPFENGIALKKAGWWENVESIVNEVP